MLWASANDWDREWIQQVVALLVGQGAFTLYPALSQCENAAERLTRWLTFQLPRIKQAHPGCPIHQWLNSIGAQVIVEKWQSPEQWPNLYWLPLPEVDGHAQGGLVLLPAHLLPAYVDGTIQTNTVQANAPANACIFWCITPLSKTAKPRLLPAQFAGANRRTMYGFVTEQLKKRQPKTKRQRDQPPDQPSAAAPPLWAGE